MASKKKFTKNQLEYNKQVKRIKSFIKRAEKRGYKFSDTILPKQPKRITKKSIEKLSNLKPKKLYEKATYYDETTNKTVTGTQGRKLERKKATEKAKQTRLKNKQKTKSNKRKNSVKAEDVILNNFRNYLKSFPIKLTAKISQFVKKLENEIGKKEVAQALQNMPLKFHEILAQVNYSSEQANNVFCSQLLEYLPNASEQYKKDAMDFFEYNESGFTDDDYE